MLASRSSTVAEIERQLTAWRTHAEGRAASLRERDRNHSGGRAGRGRRGSRGPTRRPTRRSRQVRHCTLLPGTAERLGRSFLGRLGSRPSALDRSPSSWEPPAPSARSCTAPAHPCSTWAPQALEVASRAGLPGQTELALDTSDGLGPEIASGARARRRRVGRHALDRRSPTLARRAVGHASRPPRGDGQGRAARLTRARTRSCGCSTRSNRRRCVRS